MARLVLGTLTTIALIVVTGALGATLARHQGLGAGRARGPLASVGEARLTAFGGDAPKAFG